MTASVVSDGARLDETQQHALSSAIIAGARAVVDAEGQLTSWDEISGDGDCGTTLEAGARAILEDVPTYPLASPAAVARAVSSSLEHSMGGESGARAASPLLAISSLVWTVALRPSLLTRSLLPDPLCRTPGSSGALYSIFLNALAATLAPAAIITPKLAAEAFAAGVYAISKYGGAKAGHRTMLDALIPAAAAMEAASCGTMTAMLRAGADAATAGAEATKMMQASAGRASYVPFDKMKHVPDPGAMAVAIWLTAAVGASK